MNDYLLRKDEDGEIEACDCRGCKVPTGLFEKVPILLSEAGRRRRVGEQVLREDQFAYCEVCSGTLISSIHTYPEQHREDHYILVCMAQCTNMILEAYRRNQRKGAN